MSNCGRCTIMILVIVLGMGIGVSSGAAEREIVDGVTYIRNTFDPREETVNLYLNEQWRHGGEGDGPGEVRGPRDMVLMDDGRVGVVQEVPGKMIFVDRLGNPAGDL